jgi:hypothetical protein
MAGAERSGDADLGCLMFGTTRFRRAMLDSADALDAVVCAFAARAVARGALASLPPGDAPPVEGWIAVHDGSMPVPT